LVTRAWSTLLLFMLVASSTSAVTVEWTFVGNPGNPCDPSGAPNVLGFKPCAGAVVYEFNIGTYEVTNAQYTEFLNAKGASGIWAVPHEEPRRDRPVGGASAMRMSRTTTKIASTLRLPMRPKCDL
jgi:hypothetical protein